MAHIENIHDASAEIAEQLSALLPQLYGGYAPITEGELWELLADPATHLFVARSQGRIVGTATVAVYHTPRGVRARIHDVVVDESVRRHGLGEALISACIDQARRRGAGRITLGVAADRGPANALYRKLGFQIFDQTGYVLRSET